jgi:hypothetical protein
MQGSEEAGTGIYFTDRRVTRLYHIRREGIRTIPVPVEICFLLALQP